MITAFDFETALIQPGLQAPPPVCLSIASELGARVMLSEEGLDVLEALLLREEIVGANTAFDLSVACAARPHLFDLIFKAYDEDRIFDVVIRQKLIDIALGQYRQHGGYDLANLTQRLCDRELVKEDTWRLRYWELADTPLEQWPSEAVDYSRDDSIATLDVFNEQEQSLIEDDRLCVLADQHRQGRADFALTLASAWGLRTDRVGVANLRAECEKRQEELKPGLFAEGLLKHVKKKGVIIVSKAMRVAQARMLAADPKAKLTDKGQELRNAKEPREVYRQVKYICVDAEACADSGDPVLDNYSEYSQLTSLLTNQVKAMELGIELPIHTHFEVLLDTGRTSSSGPNVQNVRRKPGARECFVPREGWCYIACDFDKAELCTLAQCCIDLFGRSNLADVLNAGYDPHTGLGARLAGTTYEDLAARVAAEEEEAIEWRQRAKPGNFGFPGGMGPNGMRRYAKSTYGVILTKPQSQHLYEGWQEEYPVVAHNYLGWIRELTAGAGHATIEHFMSKRWRGRIPYCAAANSFFQGRSGDGLKAALWEVIKLCYTPGSALYGCRVVNEVHDEIIAEAPLDIAPEAAVVMRDVMVSAYNKWVPDVHVQSTPVLMNRWSKKAKTLVGEDGRLQVWRYAA